MGVIVALGLAERFGKGMGFGLGLAFGDSAYSGSAA